MQRTPFGITIELDDFIASVPSGTSPKDFLLVDRKEGASGHRPPMRRLDSVIPDDKPPLPRRNFCASGAYRGAYSDHHGRHRIQQG